MGMTRRELIFLASMWPILQLGGCLNENKNNSENGKRLNLDPVYLLVAGSLLTSIEMGMKNEIEIPLRVEAHGSVTIAQLVKDGLKNPLSLYTKFPCHTRWPTSNSYYSRKRFV